MSTRIVGSTVIVEDEYGDFLYSYRLGGSPPAAQPAATAATPTATPSTPGVVTSMPVNLGPAELAPPADPGQVYTVSPWAPSLGLLELADGLLPPPARPAGPPAELAAVVTSTPGRPTPAPTAPPPKPSAWRRLLAFAFPRRAR